jgi:hypothetical protein
MASSPYRTPARPAADPTPTELSAFLDVAGVAAFAWVVTLVRIAAALLCDEPSSHELDFAWLVLFLAPVIVWNELAPRWRARSPPREERASSQARTSTRAECKSSPLQIVRARPIREPR